jgi:mono/diheme cytochrome c family protein
MNRQAKLRPEKPDDFFPNRLTSQLPPAGTIARSTPIETAKGAVYSFEDSPVNTGKISGTTNFVETNPLVANAALLARGREQFNIYCTPCHGGLGDGNGITKKIGAMPAVANLHDKRIVEMTDGEMFNTITHGKGLMGAYGPLIVAPDRWAIIAYTRALQLSWLGSPDELSAEQRAVLKK